MITMEGAGVPCICVFCSRRFARSDALKRHWNSCGVRKAHDLPIPTTKVKTRGRKLRACDLCFQLKRACNSSQPCTLCAMRNQNCRYSRLRASQPAPSDSATCLASKAALVNPNSSREAGHRIDTDNTKPCADLACDFDMDVYETAFDTLVDSTRSPDPHTGDVINATEAMESFAHGVDWDLTRPLLMEQRLAMPFCQRPTALDFSSLIRFPFLYKFTNGAGFVGSFQCGTRQQRLSITKDAIHAYLSIRSRPLEDGPCDGEMHWMDATQKALMVQDECTTDTSALLPVTHNIVHRIRAMALRRRHSDSAELLWSSSVEALCYKFFKPASLEHKLALFWSFWYPNWPTIHRPTFEATKKSPCLVAVMALVGACLAPDERDHASAQIWFDIVEDVVFCDEMFSDNQGASVWESQTAERHRDAQIDMLQAAYCVCLYQTWEGGKSGRRRVLRHRFNDLVYLARDIGLAQASLQCIDTSSLAAFDWEEFIFRESFIRMATYICNLDASYALFFRHTPRMVLGELLIDLSSPETCFRASSKEECFIELKAWRSRMDIDWPNNNLTILDAVNVLHDSEAMSAPAMRRVFSHLSILNMFTIVHALHLQLFRLETSGIASLASSETSLLSNALRHWRDAWPSQERDQELADLTEREHRVSTLWQRSGFIKHAPEYWLIAHLKLEKILKCSSVATVHDQRRILSVEDADMIEARSFIAEARDTSWMSDEGTSAT